MTTMQAPTTVRPRPQEPKLRAVCGLAALAAIGVVPLMGGIGGDTGAEATSHLVEHAGRMQGATILATLVSAGLIVSAVSLGRVLGAASALLGALATGAGVAVAVLYGAYYASFGAGAVVASLLLEDPGPGVGESALVMVNVMEMTRYAPGLVLVATAVAARRLLPRPIWIAAALLALMTLTPFTSWIAAAAIPIWLGVAAASGGGLRE